MLGKKMKKEIRLRDIPELSLWDYLEKNPAAKYSTTVEEHGGLRPKEESVNIAHIGNIGDFEDDIIAWIQDNKEWGNRKFFEERGFDNCTDDRPYQNLPGSVGYNVRNVGEYLWGVRGDTENQLKQLVGGHPAFEKMKMHMDYCNIRLLVYMPGNCIPYHLDSFVQWGKAFPELNPKIYRGDLKKDIRENVDRYELANRSTCDLGVVRRRIVTLTEWSFGHLIMQENTHFPKWNAGDVFNIPGGIYHLSANIGIKLKITLIVTGPETEFNAGL